MNMITINIRIGFEIGNGKSGSFIKKYGLAVDLIGGPQLGGVAFILLMFSSGSAPPVIPWASPWIFRTSNLFLNWYQESQILQIKRNRSEVE